MIEEWLDGHPKRIVHKFYDSFECKTVFTVIDEKNRYRRASIDDLKLYDTKSPAQLEVDVVEALIEELTDDI